MIGGEVFQIAAFIFGLSAFILGILGHIRTGNVQSDVEHRSRITELEGENKTLKDAVTEANLRAKRYEDSYWDLRSQVRGDKATSEHPPGDD